MLSRIGRLVSRIQRRLDGEEGFTLVELTIVMLIFGILLTIALPSYLSLEDRANKTAAKQDISQAMRAVTAYANDNFPGSDADPDLPNVTDNGYNGITLVALAARYDTSISTTPGAPFVLNPALFTPSDPSTDFCLTATVGRWTAVQHGPGGVISVGTTFAGASCSVS
jgi:prepilin-type N-terminal cleavage/methylation domain-containing protein